MNPISEISISRIFKKSSRNPELIGTNEGITIEYKESFGWKSLSEYLKAMASFANRDGGYIIFGVKDKPHKLLGLQHKDYLLNTLYEVYTSYFNSQPFSSIKPEFRYVLCWVDEALYMDR